VAAPTSFSPGARCEPHQLLGISTTPTVSL
jgi:hypothetical protein